MFLVCGREHSQTLQIPATAALRSGPRKRGFRYNPRPSRVAGLRTGHAKVAELVDALDLGSSGVTRESSSLSFRTIRRRVNDR